MDWSKHLEVDEFGIIRGVKGVKTAEFPYDAMHDRENLGPWSERTRQVTVTFKEAL